MGKPGQIFDMDNSSPWGCLSITTLFTMIVTIAIYFWIVSLLPSTEYTCNFRYDHSDIGSPTITYPVCFEDQVLEYSEPIDSLPYRMRVKGHIVDRSGDIVTLKINAYKLYSTEGFSTDKLVTQEFQDIGGSGMNIPKTIKVPKREIGPDLKTWHVILIFVFILPLVLVIMVKINGLSQNSVRYLAGTENQYSRPESKVGGFTKKSKK